MTSIACNSSGSSSKRSSNKPGNTENLISSEELKSINNELINIQNPDINCVFDETTGINYVYITDVADNYLFSLSDDSEKNDRREPSRLQDYCKPFSVLNDKGKELKIKDWRPHKKKKKIKEKHKQISGDSSKLIEVKTMLFSCNHCCCAYSTREELQKHYNISDQCRKIFTCFLCSYSTEETHVLELHLSFEHNCTQFFTCYHCFYLTGNFQDLKQHIRIKHLKLSKHKQTFNLSEMDKSDFSSVISSENPSEKPSQNVFQCSFCQFSTQDPEALELHVSFNHNYRKRFIC